ncbi:hypothetical protein N6G05_27005, partial [Cupriavidus gilardii]|uniref:hypothetical protein n=1 Tax=Cupriavidus gilardii TaxID=82541 RepID=UPI0021C1ECC7
SFEYGHTESAQSAWEAGRTALRAEHLAQQPAAQAAGLTDEGIVGIAELDGVATYETGWYRMTRAGLLAFARALLSRAAPGGEIVGYQTPAGSLIDVEEAGYLGIDTATCRALTYAAPQPSAQQAEPGSPMKAAADALRRKAELEQAHQDGYRDGFKAAQAMLDKAEQPAEEARGVEVFVPRQVIEAITRYGDARADAVSPTEPSEALGEVVRLIRALLAAPAAGAAQDEPFGWASASNGNYFTRTERIAKRIGGLIPVYTKPQAATGAQGLTWISVNDRLPPIGTGERVLIYTEGADFAGEQF